MGFWKKKEPEPEPAHSVHVSALRTRSPVRIAPPGCDEMQVRGNISIAASSSVAGAVDTGFQALNAAA